MRVEPRHGVDYVLDLLLSFKKIRPPHRLKTNAMFEKTVFYLRIQNTQICSSIRLDVGDVIQLSFTEQQFPSAVTHIFSKHLDRSKLYQIVFFEILCGSGSQKASVYGRKQMNQKISIGNKQNYHQRSFTYI